MFPLRVVHGGQNMAATISLNESDSELLRTLSLSTGKTQEQIIHEGLELLSASRSRADWRAALERTQGMWRDRDDLPDFEELRREWDRFDEDLERRREG